MTMKKVYNVEGRKDGYRRDINGSSLNLNGYLLFPSYLDDMRGQDEKSILYQLKTDIKVL